jgi:RimJ/RimL family protein N-acetyltransferase
MTGFTERRTARLILRQWRESDLQPFAELNADPEVMEHFPARLSREQSDEFAARAAARIDDLGFGLWAVEVIESGAFAGFVGLNPVPPILPIQAAGPEVGWRLARPFWGQGLASEAAQAALDVGFDTFGFEEIVSFTGATNVRSQRVMQRLGMHRDPAEDFDHPVVAEGHRLRRHVLFRMRPTDRRWRAGSA